jgi:hypothetical protein
MEHPPNGSVTLEGIVMGIGVLVTLTEYLASAI